MLTYFEREALEIAARDIRTAAGWRKLLRQKPVVRSIVAENDAKWEKCYAAASVDLKKIMAEDTATNWTAEARRITQTMLAENRMIDAMHCPPHWTKIVYCQKCGPMPYTEEVKDARACPWCAGKDN